MWFSWQAGAKTVENVTFGKQPQRQRKGWSTTTRSGMSWILKAFISKNEATGIIPAERRIVADNLSNNNIYIHIEIIVFNNNNNNYYYNLIAGG